MTHPDTIIVIGVKTLMLFPLAAQKSVPFHLSFFLFLLERKKERKRENVDTLVDRTHRRSAINFLCIFQNHMNTICRLGSILSCEVLPFFYRE